MHDYFEKRQQEILTWWDENPDTVLVKLTPEARAEWEGILKQSTAEFVKDLNPALLDAVKNAASAK